MTKLLSSVLIVVLSGCDGGTVDWEITFGGGAQASDATQVEASILRGGCDGDAEYTTRIARGGGSGMEPPELDDGVWGFSARASNGSCEWFASSCVEVTLPSSGPVSVELMPTSPMAACASDECVDGQCTGATDAGQVDSRVCATSEANCADGNDDDCDGDTDCGDSDCAAVPACELCLGVSCPECEICMNGDCVQAPSGESCTGGACAAGACCLGCIDGETCVDAPTQTTCGTGGMACAACSDCETCAASGCEPVADGSDCAGGRCVGGTCCSGCIDGTGTCVDTITPLACGLAGSDCNRCPTCMDCVGGACVPGSLGTICEEDGRSGVCDAVGLCCSFGCISGGTCGPGRQQNRCGTNGLDCSNCPGAEMCCPVGGTMGQGGVCLTTCI